jgi:predicted TIM-barrel fold metal-dependent hydrolase
VSVGSLTFVATHLGAWKDWDEVESCLVGKDVYMELSLALGHTRDEQIRRILSQHPPHRLLFGSDSPWEDQLETLERLRRLALGPDIMEAILDGNAAALLGSST